MPLRKWVHSANNAIEGIIFAAKSQRHVRYHLVFAAIVLILCLIMGVSRFDFMLLSIAIILVLLAEMVNTAIEHVVNLISPQYSEYARTAKDVAAGAVLITAFGAVFLGYIVIYPYIQKMFTDGLPPLRHENHEILLLSIVIVLITVIMLKSYYGTGTPLRGGKPSGHAAIAFSAWAVATSVTGNFLISILCFLMATLIAQSRVATNIHSRLEVFFGALLGAGITFFFYWLFS
ncbi:MAG: diacylglycerol kinase [Dissulfurispiraceae bacterium]|jgi:diacylglycerol kinase (ATP)|nr:diacylglycerol kinase [Dissulfurispiraceae bacterium]